MWPRSDILALGGLLVGLVSTLAAIHALPNRKTRLWLTIFCVVLFVGGVILIRLAELDNSAPASGVSSIAPVPASSGAPIRHSSVSYPKSSGAASSKPSERRSVAVPAPSVVASPSVDTSVEPTAARRATVAPEARLRQLPEPRQTVVANTPSHNNSSDGVRNSNSAAELSEKGSNLAMTVPGRAAGAAAEDSKQSREISPRSSRSDASHETSPETQSQASEGLSPATCDPSCQADFANLSIVRYDVPVSEQTLTRIEYVVQLDPHWPIPHYVHIIRDYYRSSSGYGLMRKSTIDEDSISDVFLSDSAAHGAKGVECPWADDECEQMIVTTRPSHQYTVRIHGALQPQSFSIVVQPLDTQPPNSR